MSLVAHVDTKRVPEAMVLEVVPPEWTDTWHPVSHRDVVQSLDKAVEHAGLQVLHREYSLNGSGTRMFGSWSIELTGSGDHNTKMGYELGIRNALDKSMAIGVCAGTRVFVCDNLAFSSEFVAFRKHTGGLTVAELEILARNALLSVTSNMQREMLWMESLKHITLGPLRFKEMVFDLMYNGIVPPSQFDTFLKHWDEEVNAIGGQGSNLFTVHGAVTRMLRDRNLMSVAKVTGMLHDFLTKRM